MEYREEDRIRFPQGLPGFELEIDFALLSPPQAAPFRYLQSLTNAALGFVLLPVEAIDAAYELRVLSEYRKVVGDGGWLTMAIVCLPASGPPTANLSGPLVIDPARRVGVQAIRDDTRYSAQTPLEWEAACS